MNKRYDVAVVGAGPAGCLTAALAAKAGLSVILLEKKMMPREKTCGGLISARALALLPRDFSLPETAAAPVWVIRVDSAGRHYDLYTEKPVGMVVQRSRFDQDLAAYAAAAGVLLKEGHPLIKLERECRPRGGYYRLTCASGTGQTTTCDARYLVGADGAGGSCAALAGLRKSSRPGLAGWGCAAVISGSPAADEQYTAVFYPLPWRGGLGWSFPGRNRVNKGVGGLAKPGLLKREFARLFPSIAGRVKTTVWPLPFTGPLLRAARGNLLLVGDAAGLVEPFSGEGIYQALKSASLAASAIITAQAGNLDAGAVYAYLFRECFTKKAFWGSLLGSLALHTRSALIPGTLPRAIEAIMRNRYWFNTDLPEEYTALTGGMEVRTRLETATTD